MAAGSLKWLGVVATALAIALAVAWLLGDRPVDVPTAPDAATRAAPAAAPALLTQEHVPDENAPDTHLARSVDRTAGSDAPNPDALWGRVVRAGTRTPVQGAEVRLQRSAADEFGPDVANDQHVVTFAVTSSADDGTFHFAVARTQLHRIEVLAVGCAPATARSCAGGTEVVVEVAPGAIVEGVVRFCGVGVADIPVRILAAGRSTQLAEARTAQNGTFWFANVPATPSVYVQALSPAHAGKWRALELRAGQRHRVEFDLQRGELASGLVVDAATGVAVADAEVSTSSTFDCSVRTDRDGRFLLAAPQSIFVRARGYATASTSVAKGKADVALVKGAEVTGRLLDEAGAPLAAAHAVLAGHLDGAGLLPRAGQFVTACDCVPAVVASDGRFVATGLQPDRDYWLHVRSDGCGSRVYALARRLANGEHLDVGDVAMRAAGSIEGRVVDTAGAPVTDRDVWLHGANADARAWLPEKTERVVPQWMSRPARTDGGGRFRFTSLAAGEFEVVAPRTGRSLAAKTKVTVRDGATASVELVVGGGSAVEGVVCFPGGRAIGEQIQAVRVRAWSDGAFVAMARPGADGRFRLDGLEDREYIVVVDACPAGWAVSPRTNVVAGANDLQLVLQPVSFVAGRVVDTVGRGRRARVYAQPAAGGPPVVRSTDAEGTFRLEVPADFIGTLSARWPGYEYVQVEQADVTAGRVDLQLQLLLPTERTTFTESR